MSCRREGHRWHSVVVFDRDRVRSGGTQIRIFRGVHRDADRFVGFVKKVVVDRYDEIPHRFVGGNDELCLGSDSVVLSLSPEGCARQGERHGYGVRGHPGQLDGNCHFQDILPHLLGLSHEAHYWWIIAVLKRDGVRGDCAGHRIHQLFHGYYDGLIVFVRAIRRERDRDVHGGGTLINNGDATGSDGVVFAFAFAFNRSASKRELHTGIPSRDRREFERDSRLEVGFCYSLRCCGKAHQRQRVIVQNRGRMLSDGSACCVDRLVHGHDDGLVVFVERIVVDREGDLSGRRALEDDERVVLRVDCVVLVFAERSRPAEGEWHGHITAGNFGKLRGDRHCVHILKSGLSSAREGHGGLWIIVQNRNRMLSDGSACSVSRFSHGHDVSIQ